MAIKLGDILARLQKKYPVLQKRIQESKALDNWQKAVGPGISKHTRTIRVLDRVLWIEVDHPIWKSEIHLRKRQIVDRLNETAGEAVIDDLYLVDPQLPKRRAIK